MKRNKSRPRNIIIAAVVLTVGIVRFIFLPQLLSGYLRHQLSQLQDYHVDFEDVSLSIVSASVVINDLKLTGKDSNRISPAFFSAEKIRISIDMNGMLKGYLVGGISVDRPQVNFIKTDQTGTRYSHISPEWTAIAQNLIAVPLNRISIHDGEIHYYELDDTLKAILSITDISLLANNLYNVAGEEKMLSGSTEATGRVMGAMIRMNLELNPFYNVPMFNLNAELTDLNLYDVKDFLKAYGNSDTHQGLFSLFAQASTRNNKIVGYVKPQIEDVTIASLESSFPIPQQPANEPPPITLTAASPAMNQIDFEGGLIENGSFNIWNAVAVTLHNAFVEALTRVLNQSPDKTTPRGRHNPSIKPQDDASKLSKQKQRKQQKKAFEKYL